jgi:hypothetical protein
MKKIKCEIWSRTVGYFRPVSQWNPGKQSEFNDRKDLLTKEYIVKRDNNEQVNTTY